MGWPPGSTIKVYFEAGQSGDLTPAQQSQYMSGLQYWTQPASNYGNLTFVNAGTGNPQGAVNTTYVAVSTAIPPQTAAAEVPVLDPDNTTLSQVVTLNSNYVNGTLPQDGTQQFHNSYIAYTGAHEGGHALGYDEDFGTDGESVMVQITDVQRPRFRLDLYQHNRNPSMRYCASSNSIWKPGSRGREWRRWRVPASSVHAGDSPLQQLYTADLLGRGFMESDHVPVLAADG
jgi:hypothetical protein